MWCPSTTNTTLHYFWNRPRTYVGCLVCICLYRNLYKEFNIHVCRVKGIFNRQLLRIPRLVQNNEKKSDLIRKTSNVFLCKIN